MKPFLVFIPSSFLYPKLNDSPHSLLDFYSFIRIYHTTKYCFIVPPSLEEVCVCVCAGDVYERERVK